MADNLTLLQKADLVIADIATAGQLANEQAARFVRKVLEAPTLLRVVRSKEMRSPKAEINKIGFGSRILKPAVENTALSSGDRSKPSFEQVLLQTKEVIAEVRIPYAVMEDSIEQGMLGQHRDAGGTAMSGGIRDTIVDLIAERAAVDLEELAISGDTASGDPYLALQDGFLKLATSNVVDVTSAKIDKGVFADGLRAMPDKHKRELSRMRHFIAPNVEIDYRESLSDRGTGLGDSMIQGTNGLWGMGVPVQSVDLMPNASGLLCDPRNLIFGIQRQVSMEFDKDIHTRQYVIVLTARVDFQIEEIEAVVKYTNIG